MYGFVWPLVNALLLSQGPTGLKGQKVSHLSTTITEDLEPCVQKGLQLITEI